MITAYLQCKDDDNRNYGNVCNMLLISFSLAMVFNILFENMNKLIKTIMNC